MKYNISKSSFPFISVYEKKSLLVMTRKLYLMTQVYYNDVHVHVIKLDIIRIIILFWIPDALNRCKANMAIE